MTKEQRLKKRLRSKADKLWFNLYLKERCEVCGSTDGLQGHHFYYKKSYPHLRYDPDNHITLCKRCHFLLHHQDPKKIENKIIETRGKRWYNKLTKKAQQSLSSFQTIEWYKENIERMTKEYDQQTTTN